MSPSLDGCPDDLVGELRAILEPMLARAPFDENWYLAAYPDVAEAVLKDRNLSAHSHFIWHGYFDGRAPGTPELTAARGPDK